MKELTADQAIALRLRGQYLDRRAPAKSLVDVCGAIGGAQAQVGSAARMSLAARLEGVTDGAVQQALERDKTLVKTWTVRGTLHLVPATDLPWYVAAFGHRRLAAVENWLGRVGLTRRALEALSDDIVGTLADGPLTRREISRRVAMHGALAKRMIEHSWGGALRWAVHEGRMCFGPMRGSEITFVRTDRWLGALPTIPRETAEREMVRRFLAAYGPATAHDLGYWAGLYVPEAKRLWDLVADDRVDVKVEGRTASILRGTRVPPPAASAREPHVRLLPNFDVYLLGHRAKEAVLAPARYKSVFKSAGWIAPVVLVDGRVAGVWRAERTAARLGIKVSPFGRLDAAARPGVSAEIAALGTFLGLPVRRSARAGVRKVTPGRPWA